MVEDVIRNVTGGVSLHLHVQKVSYRFVTTSSLKLFVLSGLSVCDQIT